MHSLNDTYRFFYNSPLTGPTQCYPANDAIEFVWEKTDNFYRRKINTPLKFIKTDFQNLHQIERSADRCEKIDFTVEIKCGESFFPYWSGFLALVNGNFNVSKCFVDITPRLEDEYTCFLRNWDKEKDFIGGEGAPAEEPPLGYFQGVLEQMTCQMQVQDHFGDPDDYGLISDCLSPGPWLWRGNRFDTDFDNTGSEILVVISYFIREVYSGTDPEGEGWESIGTNLWARVPTGNFDLDNPNGTILPQPIKHGRKLTAVIQFLLNDCGLTLKSDFYNYNYLGDSPANFAYSYADAYFGRLVIFQTTDIKRLEDADQFATKADIKLKDLLEALQAHHNISWAIENGEFILEHASFFADGANMLDLTQDNLKAFIAGKHEYKYLVEELPRSEKWEFSIQTLDIDFDGVPITYEETCSYDEDGKDVEYPIGGYFCDIQHILNNKEDYPDKSYVLLAAHITDNYMLTTTGELSGTNKLNGPLALSNTMYYLQRHKRPQARGVMNNQPEQFYNVQKKRAQPEISIPICCEDLLQFDPADYVKSQLGWGEVAGAKYNTKTKLLSLELNFD